MFDLSMLAYEYVKNKGNVDCEDIELFFICVQKRIGRELTEEEEDWIFNNFDPESLGLND